MNWKEFLKPNRKKIILALILVILSFAVIFSPFPDIIISFFIYFFTLPMILSYFTNFSMFLLIFLSLLWAYLFSCLIWLIINKIKNKEKIRKRWVIIDALLVSLFILGFLCCF